MSRVCVAGLLVLAGFRCGGLLGQERTATPSAAPSELDGILAAITQAKAEFRPYPAERVPAARARLERAMQQLEPYFSRGSVENTARWREYLRWDLLQSELAASEGPTLSRWQPILVPYFQNHEALEHPYFVEMRAALLDYRNALGMASSSNLERNITAQLDSLANRLPQYEREPTMQLANAIGNAVSYLEMARQAPEVIRLVRARYWHPNLYATVSQQLINGGLGVDVDEAEDVWDCILGTRIVGTAQLHGQTMVQLVDRRDKAHLQLFLRGTILSQNVGYNRSVRVLTEGTTEVAGKINILLDAEGVTSEASAVHCDTDSRINAICAPSRIVTRIARNQARKSKGRAEQIGSQHAEERVAEKMDQRADELLAQVRETYDRRFRNPLIRRNEFPEDLTFRTQDGLLKVLWRQANESQLAAANVPVPVAVQNDLSVQLHESFVANFSRAMLANVRLDDRRLVEILEKNNLVVPEKLRSDETSWAITFSFREAPVSASFSQNQIRFAICGRKFESGQTIPVEKEMELSAVYQLEPFAEGMRFVRQGDVVARYLDPDVRGRDSVVIKVIMQEKFEALFTPVIELREIQLPGRWGAGGDLHLQQMVSQLGWLQAAWLQVQPESGPAAKTTANN